MRADELMLVAAQLLLFTHHTRHTKHQPPKTPTTSQTTIGPLHSSLTRATPRVVLLTGAVGSLEHATIDLAARLVAAAAQTSVHGGGDGQRPAKRAKVVYVYRAVHPVSVMQHPVTRPHHAHSWRSNIWSTGRRPMQSIAQRPGQCTSRVGPCAAAAPECASIACATCNAVSAFHSSAVALPRYDTCGNFTYHPYVAHTQRMRTFQNKLNLV